MTLSLYQFPISHYCEKVRFALDYKGLSYNTVNLVPGLHAKTTTRLARRSSVPVIEHQGKQVQGSASIIDYLDETFAERPLSPADDAQRQQAIEWERWLDDGAGIDVRRLCYHHLLPERKIVTAFFTQGAGLRGRAFLLFAYPKLAKTMRKLMDINEQSAALSLQRIEQALDRLASHYAKQDYLVGDQFSRADLSAAALFAPMFQPAGYGLDWPAQLPPALAEITQRLAPQLAWGNRIYQAYR